MIPHRYKPKLPNYLSYPIGFEAISGALKHIPMFDEIELTFSIYNSEGATSFRETVKSKKPHVLVSATFIRWDKRPSIGDEWEAYLRGKWELRIYPCGRESRAIAKTALIRDGLPEIARWLSATRPPAWYWARKRCDVVFLPDKGTIELREFDDAV
jgi:hypothetical protein